MRKFAPLAIAFLLIIAVAIGGSYLTQYFNNRATTPVPVTGEVSVIENPGNELPAVPDSSATPSNDLAPPPTAPPVTGSKPPASDQDHTVHSWWFTRKGQHETPGFDSYAMATVPGKGFFLGDTSGKKVFLTFDEGYENGYTSKILDTLQAHNLHVAFFVTGSYVDNQPELVKRMVSEGHIVANHTTNHPSLPKLSDAKIEKEIMDTHGKVQQLTGVEMRFLRPPMGEYNSRVLEVINKLGYKAVFWSMAYKDWEVDNQPGREAAYSQVMDNLHPGAIILLHAVSQSNSEALDDIIKGVMAEGYSFATLDSLL